MSANLPLISVVTPCLNRAGMVADAIESVLAQNYPHFEHVVVDGGSTDGTRDVLARYPHLRLICEPDKNLYDAFNKGIRAARGDVIAHLNTDDFFPPGVFGPVAEAFAADPSLDAVYGGVAVCEDGTRRELLRYDRAEDLELSIPRIARNTLSINPRFFRRDVYDRVGLFDIRYRIASDLEFLLRASRFDLKSAFLPAVVYVYRQHAGSLTVNKQGPSPRNAGEVMAIAEEALDRWPLTGEERRALATMHTHYSVGGISHAARRGMFGTAARFAARGWFRNPLWPLWAARAAALMAAKPLAPSGR